MSYPEPSRKRPKALGDEDETMLCKRVVTKDRRYITQITCYEKGQNGKANLGKPISRTPMRMPLFGKQGGGVLSSLFSKIGRQGEVSALLRIAETQFLREFQTMIGMIHALIDKRGTCIEPPADLCNL